jgi:multimeric flavodoxin WrbA
MNILAIMGSPHKGNSFEITQQMQRKLEAFGDVEFDYVHLKDVDLKPCKGCFTCFIKGENSCPLKDDGAMIAGRLDWADGIILVSPVYSMHVSYLMKQFIDRFAYTFHRPRYFGKYALAVAVAGNTNLKETLKYLADTANGWGFECVGRLGYRAAPKNTPMRALATGKDRTDQVLLRFHTTIKEKHPRKLTFMDHFGFRVMQVIYARMETMSPTDYQYWNSNGWLKKGASYYRSNVRPNLLWDLIARFISWMIGQQVDKALAESV